MAEPLSSAQWQAMNSPASWKIGSMGSSTSPGAEAPVGVQRLRVVGEIAMRKHRTPLERPVVPEEAGIAARSRPCLGTRANSSACGVAASISEPRPSSRVRARAVPCSVAPGSSAYTHRRPADEKPGPGIAEEMFQLVPLVGRIERQNQPGAQRRQVQHEGLGRLFFDLRGNAVARSRPSDTSGWRCAPRRARRRRRSTPVHRL